VSRATSQPVWIDVGDPAAGSVGTRFSGELAEQVLRDVKLPGPLLVVRKFLKQPAANTILLVRRRRRHFAIAAISVRVMDKVYRMSASRPTSRRGQIRW